MNVRLVLRFVTVLLCAGCALYGGAIINLKTYTPTAVLGDVYGATAYTTDASGTPVTYNPPPGYPGVTVIGGVLDPADISLPPNSHAVSATSQAATGWTAYDTFGFADVGNGATPTGYTTATLPLALGLATADLNAKLADPINYGVATGSAIVWDNVSVTAGDEVDMLVNFVCNDYGDFFDMGFFSWVAKTGGTKGVIVIDDLSSVGPFNASGWKTFTHSFATSDTYILSFGVVNVGPYFSTGATAADGLFNFDATDAGYMDNIGPALQDSALLLETPEPGAYLLSGTALLLLALRLRRKSS